MKDVSTASKYRSHAYPKTRPTPLSMGVSKRKSPLANPGPRRQGLTPKSLAKQQQLKLNMFAEPQISRAAQIAALGNLGKLLEEEYRTDVESYMHEMERQTMSSATSMDQQPEIRWHMRPCLVDFLLEVHLNFKLRPEVLYLACNIVDRYVSRRVVFVKHYQLVGCAALWIAAKFEEAKERVPTLRELHHICHQAYDETAFVQMEGHVLNTIGWCVGHPTAEAWLRVHCTGASFEDQQTQDIARFLMEITLYHREYVEHPPSAIAAAALVLARHTVGKPRRPSTETEAALAVVDLLDSYLAAHVDDLSQTLVAKYSAAYYSRASTFIIQYYLGGRRFTRQPILPYLPVTPSRGHTSQPPVTPMSEADSEGPITPTTPAFHAVATIAGGKENVPSNNIFADVVAKLPSTEDSTMYYPSPVITRKGSRPALHERNGVFSPVA